MKRQNMKDDRPGIKKSIDQAPNTDAERGLTRHDKVDGDVETEDDMFEHEHVDGMLPFCWEHEEDLGDSGLEIARLRGETVDENAGTVVGSQPDLALVICAVADVKSKVDEDMECHAEEGAFGSRHSLRVGDDVDWPEVQELQVARLDINGSWDRGLVIRQNVFVGRSRNRWREATRKREVGSGFGCEVRVGGMREVRRKVDGLLEVRDGVKHDSGERHQVRDGDAGHDE